MSLPLFSKFFLQRRIRTNKTFCKSDVSEPLSIIGYNYFKKLNFVVLTPNSIKVVKRSGSLSAIKDFYSTIMLKNIQTYFKSNKLFKFNESEALTLNKIRYSTKISVAYRSRSACPRKRTLLNPPPSPTFYAQHLKKKAHSASLTSRRRGENTFILKHEYTRRLSFVKTAQKKRLFSFNNNQESSPRANSKVAVFETFFKNLSISTKDNKKNYRLAEIDYALEINKNIFRLLFLNPLGVLSIPEVYGNVHCLHSSPKGWNIENRIYTLRGYNNKMLHPKVYTRRVIYKNLIGRVRYSLSKKAALVLEQLKYINFKSEVPGASGYSFNKPKCFFYKTIALSVIVKLLNKIKILEKNRFGKAKKSTLKTPILKPKKKIKKKVFFINCVALRADFFYLTCFFYISALTFRSCTVFQKIYKNFFLEFFYKNKKHLLTTLVKKNKKKTSTLYSFVITLQLINRFLTSTAFFYLILALLFKASPLLFMSHLSGLLRESPNNNLFLQAAPNFKFIYKIKNLFASGEKKFSFNNSSHSPGASYRNLTKETYLEIKNKKYAKNIYFWHKFYNTPWFMNPKKTLVIKSTIKELSLFRGCCFRKGFAEFISAIYKLKPKVFIRLNELKELTTLKALPIFNQETNITSFVCTSKNLWVFLKKRHNQKSLKWIFKKYCLNIDSYVYLMASKNQAKPTGGTLCKRTKILVKASFFTPVGYKVVLTRASGTTPRINSGITLCISFGYAKQCKVNTIVFLEEQ